jgi:hypothetical protein
LVVLRAKLKQLNALEDPAGYLQKGKRRAVGSSSPSPTRLYSMMHKKSKQDNDWEGDPQQPQQCASSESHGYSPFVFQTNNSLDLKEFRAALMAFT